MPPVPSVGESNMAITSQTPNLEIRLQSFLLEMIRPHHSSPSPPVLQFLRVVLERSNIFWSVNMPGMGILILGMSIGLVH
jgi:hypothetical protein